MHIITRKRLNDFAAKHPDSTDALERWYRIVKKTDSSDFVVLRKIFPSADQVNQKTVFNIGGNKYRLITAIHYNRRKIYIRHVLTHSEYDRNGWKND